MPDYQSIHLDDLLAQLEKMDVMREVEKFASLHLQESKSHILAKNPINQIIELLSSLEIAAITRLVPEQLPDTIFPNLVALFNSQPLREVVSQSHSDNLLISLFLRTAGALPLYDGDQECLPTFFQFSTLSSGLREDESVQEFCRLMTDFEMQESIDRAFSSPVALVETITQSRVSHSLFTFTIGLSRFLLLCQEFNDLLKELERYPLLQSAYWHYNARIVLMPGVEKLIRLLHKVQSWTEEESTLLFQTSPKLLVRSTTAAYEELTGGLYQQELPKRLMELIRSLRPVEQHADTQVNGDSELSDSGESSDS